MSGRITNNMLSSNYLRNMNRNLVNMKTLQNQLASGKEINKASDNPYKTSRSMQLHAEISYNKQYNENIKDTSNWLDTTDTALSQMGNVFGRIETLLVSSGNGAYGEDEKIAIQDEIKEKVNELSQILNTSFDGSYIFGGTKVGSKPTAVDENGILRYADGNGKAIKNIGYKDADGKITSTAGATNAQIYLSATDITNLQKELDGLDYSTTSGTDFDRINDINNLLYNTSVTPPQPTPAPTVPITALEYIKSSQENIKNSTATKEQIDFLNSVSKVIQVNQINSELKVDISQGVSSAYNKNAIEIMEFKDKSGKDISVSELLNNIITDLGTGGITDNLTTTHLKDIQSVTANLLKQRSAVGSMQNRMDSAKENNETQNYNMTDILSKTEDIDFAEKTMEYSMMQTVYTAALQTSAKILPMTILTYL